MTPDANFWDGRRVLVTGHSGFKGAWLSLWLEHLGARVTGLSTRPPPAASMHALTRVADGLEEISADVRSFAAVHAAVEGARPEVVLHLAAQPFVRRSLHDPRTTYEVNVMGTVNVLEAVRGADGVRAVVAVTSDKAYDNRGTGRPFVEDDPKGGADPYSSSKGCAELVVDAYLRSYFAPGAPAAPRVGAARAGNVIGGGDWGEDRLVPDLVRAAQAGEPLRIRNPDAVRPWQHVLEPLSGYLTLAQALVADPQTQGGWNFGPPAGAAPTVGELAARLAALWPGDVEVIHEREARSREAAALALDSTKAREQLGWTPRWDLDETLRAVVAWHAAHAAGDDLRAVTLAQIEAYERSRPERRRKHPA
ncbi:MAG: CDP-glucose 4,6-dehydratase [Solirubrobacteraceae bacterium MAG38_C4-C5]|nr:CDP-glucose 4,6-dehydratase [Candidatus Siliceabacter maunaloa]